MQALSDVKPGETCTIKWMFGTPEVMNFMRSRHIEEGSTLYVLQKGMGSLIVRAGDVKLVMDETIAQRIKV